MDQKMQRTYQQHQHDINRTSGLAQRQLFQQLQVFGYEAIKALVNSIKYMVSMFFGKY